MRRYRPAAFAAAAAVTVAVIVAIALAGSRDVAVPSPSPTSLATKVAPSPSPSPSSSPPASSPSTTRYISALLGYSIELPPPWHRSSCNGVVTQQTPVPFGEVFVSVPVQDEGGTDIGVAYPTVTVMAEPNPQALSPRQWVEQQKTGRAGQQTADATFAGRPAVRLSYPDLLPSYYVANAGRMYGVIPEFRSPPELATQQTMVRIVESFRFITDAEQAAARAALPTAAPPRTPEEAADGVAAAFAAKDVAALGAFAAPCVFAGGEQAGASTVSREKYLENLRTAFAAGLVVTVRPRPFDGDRALGEQRIASTWTDPRDPKGPLDRKLVFSRGVNDRWAWVGTIERFR